MLKHARTILISLLLLLFSTSCKVPDPNRFLMFINEKNDFLLQREFLHDSVNTSFIPVDCISDVSFNNENQQIVDNYNIDGSIVFLYSNIKVPADVESQSTKANKDDQLDLNINYTCDSSYSPVNPPAFSVINRDGEIVALSVSQNNFSLTDVRSTKIIPTSNNGNGSKTTANSYYANIDPGNLKKTLDDWYSENGFNNKNICVNSSNNCIIKAVYLNNVDLALGRLMKVIVNNNSDPKVSACVENYGFLKLAIEADKNNNRAGMIAAVCMEYGVFDGGQFQQDVTSFYTYDGEGNRTTVVDLDSRGDKYQPGVCLSCHGGKNNNQGTPFQSGVAGTIKMNAGFIPWDLDNFKFSEEQGYTRADQEVAFRLMNEAVLLTYPDNAPIRELVHGWYSSSNTTSNILPKNKFDGNYVLSGWSDSDLYHKVYARSCRACHMQQTIYGTSGIHDFNSQSELTVSSKSRVFSYVYEQGVMPLAKRTFDLFWDDLNKGGNSKAGILYNSLGLSTAFDANFNSVKRTMPGKPIADIVTTKKSYPDSTEHIMLDGRGSLFAESYSWKLRKKPAGSIARIIGADTSTPTLILGDSILSKAKIGSYEISLKVSNLNQSTRLIEDNSIKDTIEVVSPGTPPTAITFKSLFENTINNTCISSGCHNDNHSTFKMFKNDQLKTFESWKDKSANCDAINSRLITFTNSNAHRGKSSINSQIMDDITAWFVSGSGCEK